MKLFEPIRIIARSGDPYQNPIVVVLTRGKDPSFNREGRNRVPTFIIDGLLMTCLYGIGGFAVTYVSLDFLPVPITTPILIIIPVVFTIHTANLTSRIVKPGGYQLIKMTPIGAIKRVWGVMFAALHQLRFLVELSIILLADNIAVTAFLTLFKRKSLYTPQNIAAVIPITIGLAGMHIIGLLAGALAGLKYEKRQPAILVSTSFTLSVILFILLIISWLAIIEMTWVAVGLSTVPFLLIIGAFHLAEQWA